ncbi:MAG TPA: hypothetical protein VFG24_09420 [Nitrosopumilaceae archaeon]|nr:hypothetical protein [Nitrosopumilaceae archaeon]
MKAYITFFHKNNSYEGTLIPLFKAFDKVSNVDDCDVVIMPITYLDNYVFDVELMETVRSSGKKIVIVDFVEYGWDILKTNHLFGVNTNSWYEKFKNLEYLKLDDFISKYPRIILYFKREFIDSFNYVKPFNILPIEYPGVSTLPNNKVDSFEEYNNRPIDVIMVWGLSNPSRPILHGEFVKQSALNGQHLVSNIDHVTVCQSRGDKRMVVMAHIPDFARQSISILLHLQSMAKISISMSGAGCKCFRSTEASYNAVMAIQENHLAWSYPWIDKVNSIELPNRENSVLINEYSSYEKIMECLSKPEELYEMYLNGTENWRNYEIGKYSTEYILKEIQNNI